MSNKLITFNKLANHWYANLNHFDPNSLVIDPKLERLFNTIDTYNLGKIDIEFIELHSIVEGDMILNIGELDITRYLTTDDNFQMNAWINRHHFYLSSSLYFLLEQEHQFNFHETFYKINIW